jgi:predicted RNA-binding protein with PUA-like domain
MANFWLFKSEPETWSWAQQQARGAKGEAWTGVRNYGARNHMRAMKLGDLGFFYHSGEERAVVGIVRVSGPLHPDAEDDTGKWECVDIEAVAGLPTPVTLDYIRTVPELAEMVLVKNSRLSVQPVTPEEFKAVCKLGGLKAGKMPAAAR